MYKPIRVSFCKKDNAVYFSHLDLNRTVMRLLRKSGVDFWYTEGFNPHPYIVFACPLPLGTESQCEIFEFKGSEIFSDEDRNALAAAFPECLKINEVYESPRKFKEIAFADYEISMRGRQDILPLFDHPLMVLKKTKRNEKTVDVRDFIEDARVEFAGDRTCFRGNIMTGDVNLNPSYLITALREAGVSCEDVSIKRIAFLDHHKNLFR